ncbi:MAG: sugar MFS transporter [Bacteroidota bacterium]
MAIPSNQNLSGQAISQNGKSINHTFSFIVVTCLFFLWGFITCMNDILIPYMKKVFVLNYTQGMMIQLCFFGAYFIGSILYFIISSRFGDPINKIGYKNGILLGLVISALGTALFYPAAEYALYGFFLAALFILGLGFTLLQIAANPYVAILGEEKTASSRLNLSQGFNSFGTTIAPLLGGYFIFQYFASHDPKSADSVVVPYMVFTAAFLLMALVIKFVKLPSFTNKEQFEKKTGALRFPNLSFGIIAIFMYVGAEVSVGSMLISFLGLPEIAGLTEKDASVYVAYYWGGLMIGRFLGAFSLSSMKREIKFFTMIAVPLIAFGVISYFENVETALIYGIFMLVNFAAFMIGGSKAARTLFIFSIFCAALLGITMFSSGETAMWCVIGVGLFNSIMWSNIFTLSIAGLGKYTSQGSSLLVMAIVGGALLPVLMGMSADAIGVHNSFYVPLLAYIYIAFYGIRGYKQKRLKNE